MTFLNNEFFIFISIVMLLTAFMVISTNNPIYSIFFLILMFAWLALILLNLGIEFLAMLLLIVYIGAIAVLFLFVVMLLNIRIVELNQNIIKFWWLAFLLALTFILNITMALMFTDLNVASISDYNVVSWIQMLEGLNNIGILGQLIYTYYSYMLFLAALILLVAMIGAIVLTMNDKKA